MSEGWKVVYRVNELEVREMREAVRIVLSLDHGTRLLRDECASGLSKTEQLLDWLSRELDRHDGQVVLRIKGDS